MGQLVFQATLGGQVNLVGPNTASTFNLNVPAVSSTIASLAAQTFAGTQTFTVDAVVNGLTVGKGGGAVANNTAIGASSLNATNTGTGLNTAVGAFSLYTNTSGSESVAIGYEALRLNTTGTYNVALGQGSLRSNTTAQENTAVGNNSMRTNTTGASNSALGSGALFANTTGSSNTGLGYNALAANTTASNNTAVGYQAGYTNSVGTGSVFIGYQAGYTSAATATNGYNVCVGLQAGYGLTTGVDNTFVGGSKATGSGSAITSGSKNTILGCYSGNQGGLDIRTSSNYIVLADGDGNPRGVCYNDAGWKFGNGGTGDVVQARSGNGANTVNSLYTGWYSATSPTNGTLSFNVTTNGNVYNTNNSYGSLSDVKLKENITDATPKLEQLCQVRVVNYNFKEGQTQKQLGVIAQELEAVFPSMVDEAPDRDLEGNDLGTTTKSVKYSVFVPILIKAVQELKTIVDAQAAEITALKAKVGI